MLLIALVFQSFILEGDDECGKYMLWGDGPNIHFQVKKTSLKITGQLGDEVVEFSGEGLATVEGDTVKASWKMRLTNPQVFQELMSTDRWPHSEVRFPQVVTYYHIDSLNSQLRIQRPGLDSVFVLKDHHQHLVEWGERQILGVKELSFWSVIKNYIPMAENYAETAYWDCTILEKDFEECYIACDTAPPILVGLPESDTIIQYGCNMQTIPVVAHDSKGNQLDVIVTDTVRAINCGKNSGVYICHWTATDSCGNVGSDSRIIVLKDTMAPVFDSYSYIINVCDSSDLEVLTATDNCSEVIISYEDIGTSVRVWTATDACGNVSEAIQQLSVIQPDTIRIFDTICQGDYLIIEDSVMTESGQYVFPSEDKCGTMLIQQLSVLQPDTTFIQKVLCPRQNFVFGDSVVTEPGRYVFFRGDLGRCGKHIVFDVEVQETKRISANAKICEGEMFSFGGKQISASGEYRDTVKSIAGCDSIITTLNLAIIPSYNIVVDTVVCPGEDIPQDAVYTSATGCDSAITYIVTVDTVAPTFVSFPSDLTVEYGQVIELSEPIATDDGETKLPLGFMTDTTGTSCSGITIINTWTATDDCGNDTSHTQLINLLPLELRDTVVLIACDSVTLPDGEIVSESGWYETAEQTDKGCDSIVTFDITINQTEIGISQSDVSCFGLNDGNIFVSVTEGVAPFSFEWNTGDSLSFQTELEEGLYSVFVTDANGCIAEEEVEISQPDSLSIDFLSTVSATCGNADGSIEITEMSGGVGGVSFSWASGSSDSFADSLAAGVHAVTITDENGCQLVDSLFLLETGCEGNPEPPTLGGEICDLFVEQTNPGDMVLVRVENVQLEGLLQYRIIDTRSNIVLDWTDLGQIEVGQNEVFNLDTRSLQNGQYVIHFSFEGEADVAGVCLIRTR